MLVACRQDDPALANPTWAYGGSVGVRLGLLGGIGNGVGFLRQPGLPRVHRPWWRPERPSCAR